MLPFKVVFKFKACRGKFTQLSTDVNTTQQQTTVRTFIVTDTDYFRLPSDCDRLWSAVGRWRGSGSSTSGCWASPTPWRCTLSMSSCPVCTGTPGWCPHHQWSPTSGQDIVIALCFCCYVLKVKRCQCCAVQCKRWSNPSNVDGNFLCRSQSPQSSPWSLMLRSPSLLWLQPGSGLSVLQCMELLCLLGNKLTISPIALLHYGKPGWHYPHVL